MISAFAARQRLVLGQFKVAEKFNEIHSRSKAAAACWRSKEQTSGIM